MAQKSKIEWTDSTWSPIRVRVKADAAVIARDKGYIGLIEIAEKMAGHVGQHCEHVSPGCLHCYAETNNHRCLPGNGTGFPYDRRSRDLVTAFIDGERWHRMDDEFAICFADELRYAELRGMLRHHPTRPELVQLVDQETDHCHLSPVNCEPGARA